METVQDPLSVSGQIERDVHSISVPAAARLKITTRFVLFGMAIIAGFIGGSIAIAIFAFYGDRIALWHTDTHGRFAIGEANIKDGQRALSEDQVIMDLVEKNSPAVVSIVVSQDISKNQNQLNGSLFFPNPFRFWNGTGSSGNSKDNNDSSVEKQQIGSGSGFFVSSDGLIVTNKHVVSNEQAEYTVVLNGSDKEYPAKVLARDPNNDIAIIKIEGDGFPMLTLGDSDTIKVGQTVLAIGNPLGEFANSVSRGIISGLKRNVTAGSNYGESEKLTNIIQTDAAVNPGNSGGPLFDLSGDVIGINVAMAQGAENIAFSLPINTVKRAIDQVRSTGKISTPYLGVRYVILDKSLSKQYNFDFDYGALVLRGQNITDLAVIPGSPADKAGLIENDVILEIDGQKIDEQHTLASLIADHQPGDDVTMKVWHKGDTKTMVVHLEEWKQ